MVIAVSWLLYSACNLYASRPLVYRPEEMRASRRPVVTFVHFFRSMRSN